MAERTTIWKWFWVWNFEKEERWLNEMAMNGWKLVDVGFCRYTFEACEPGEYTVRMEMHEFDDAYLSFMEETGAEYVGRMVHWIYFRRRTELGPFDIFSDMDSRISHLSRIGKMLLAAGLLNLGIGLANSFNGMNLGWINLLCATLLMYALGRIHGKKEALEKDRMLHE
ncbi:MAG: DUF2812 domain-containing protein [Oscillospiraceae bacterium]